MVPCYFIWYHLLTSSRNLNRAELSKRNRGPGVGKNAALAHCQTSCFHINELVDEVILILVLTSGNLLMESAYRVLDKKLVVWFYMMLVFWISGLKNLILRVVSVFFCRSFMKIHGVSICGKSVHDKTWAILLIVRKPFMIIRTLVGFSEEFNAERVAILSYQDV